MVVPLPAIKALILKLKLSNKTEKTTVHGNASLIIKTIRYIYLSHFIYIKKNISFIF